MPAVRPWPLLVSVLAAGCFADHPPTLGSGTDDPSSDGGTTAAMISTTGGVTGGSGPETTSSATTGATTGDDCDPGMSPKTWYIDQDDDGWGAGEPILACTRPDKGVSVDGDCDDGQVGVNPDAIELCNQVDDDCDALVDEVSALNKECDGCALRQKDGEAWWLCVQDGPDWTVARAGCQVFGAEMASVRTADEDVWLAAEVAMLGLPAPADATLWIGLRRDETVADTCAITLTDWNWTDGAPFAYVNWGFDQPDNHPTADGCPMCTPAGFADPACPRENCVDYLGDGGWNDAPCTVAGQGFVCRASHAGP